MSKTPHPYFKSNLFQRVFHSWAGEILRLGSKRSIELDDLFEILPNDQSKLWTDRLERAWKDELRTLPEKESSLFRATWKVYGKRYSRIGICLFIYTIFRFIQPFVLARFIRYFSPCSTVSFTNAIILAIVICIFPWIMLILRHTAFANSFLAGMHLRCAYSELIFRKLIKLSMTSLGIQYSGKIVNLLTNDVQAVEQLAIDGHYIWIGFMETIVVLSILWIYIGTTVLFAFVYTILVLVAQMICGKCVQLIWTRRVHQTDLRLKLMNEIVKSIHLVKMYVWEKPFQFKVARVRTEEIFYMIFQSFINTLKIVNAQSFSIIFFLIIFGSLWYRQVSFDTDFFTVAFVLISYLRHTYLHNFSFACIGISKYKSSCSRMKDFLISDEYQQSKAIIYNLNTTNQKSNCPEIDVRNVASKWNNNSTFQLQDITFSAKSGDLIMIIGPIASGKSSLLMALLSEMEITNGNIIFNKKSRLCYVSQEPWIFSGTIQENILFGLDYNSAKYSRCIHATAFHIDLENLPYGPSTLVGDNGIVLSGGQKARLSLARALYRDDDIYLLDDPLSAVDVEVGRHIFEKCILGKLKSKICVLATHQIQFLKYATRIIFLDKGKQIAIGTFAELLQTCSEFTQWIEIAKHYSLTNANSINQSLSDCSLTSDEKQNTRVSFVSANSRDEEDEALLPEISTKPIQKEITESKQTGSVRLSVFQRYVKAGGCALFNVISLFILFALTSLIILLSNWWLGRWSNAESIRYQVKNTSAVTNCSLNKQTFINSTSNNEWKNQNDRFFHVLLGLSSLSVILLFVRTMTYFLVCHNTAKSLHNQMFHSLLRAPIYFYDTNPVGRIINRYSKDILSIDDQLSNTTYNFIDVLFGVITNIMYIAYVQPLSLISMAICGFIMEKIRRIYASSVQDMKRLESLTRSPIYSHLSSSMQGLTTIRSYGVQEKCLQDFSHYLDENSRVYSLMLGMTRCSAMRIDCVVASFIGFLTFSMLFTYRSMPISDVSLMLAYSFTLLGGIQWIVRLTVDLMVQMTSVERVLEYIDLEQEDSSNITTIQTLPVQWPTGEIIFDNLSFRYSRTSPWILKNLNITIKTNSKIGIVGRTGAGKSSLIQSLFRMAEIDGRILIDGIDTKQISLYDLRRHMSIIPQDPVLFNDTLRMNLDPFGEYSDTEIWNALEQVQLKSLMSESLEQEVTEGGSNFSVGQRQLICLARAILRKNKILIIDEATANVDHKTDEFIQSAIRRRFVNCTVLTIAHRLRTIIDSDQILVLSNGEIVEFDSPYELLSDETSEFAQLVSQMGDSEATHLIQKAKFASINHRN